ncbi:MAG: BadF/BadG/BcrA/BcrD ATPase family protein [Candidatus Lustribacter sp.]|jgi:N-acetylglucosamine kinase-like BadF-type ATPase
MPLFAGIDGGQSSTVAVVLDEHGKLLGRGTAGPSDHVDEPPESQRAALACESALAAALAAAHAPAGTELAAVVVGLSGYEGAWYGREPSFGASAVRYKHDSAIALAGAIRERPAAIVIAGTGSAAYGETAQRTSVRAGGFGYLFGDEGSGFAIARTALAGAMRVSDRGVLTDLGAAALAFFDCGDLRALARAVSLRRISRPQVAGFARVVMDAARLGDPEAAAIVEDAAAALAGLAQLVVEQLGHADMPAVPVAFVGGAVENTELRSAAQRRLEAATPLARVVAPAFEPAVGAAFLAFDAAGVARPSH